MRHNCEELLAEFELDVAKDGRIDLHLEDDMSSFLSVLYLNNTETGEITDDQESYIDTLLAKYETTDCNPNKVLLKTSVNLDEIAAARLPRTPHPELVSLYAQVIGELMFIAIITQQRKIIWCAARIEFPFVPCEIYANSDASWADIVPQRKSSLSYLIFCNNAVFSWTSSLSSVLAMSSAEAELIALCVRLCC